MYGARTLVGEYDGLEWDMNQSVFYNYSEEIDFGLEVNYVSGTLSPAMVQVVPQLHLAFKHGAIIQIGFGARKEAHQKLSSLTTFRLIWEFN